MQKMKRCILSMLLTICLVAWLMPVTALADDPDITWDEILQAIAAGNYVEDPLESGEWAYYQAGGRWTIHIEEGITVSKSIMATGRWLCSSKRILFRLQSL